MQQSPPLLCSYRFWRRAVIFPKGRVFGHVGIEVLHLVTVVDPVGEAPDHQILPGEGLQHGHLLLLRGLVKRAPGYSDSSQLGIGKPDEKCSDLACLEKLLSFLPGDEAK